MERNEVVELKLCWKRKRKVATTSVMTSLVTCHITNDIMLTQTNPKKLIDHVSNHLDFSARTTCDGIDYDSNIWTANTIFE